MIGLAPKAPMPDASVSDSERDDVLRVAMLMAALFLSRESQTRRTALGLAIGASHALVGKMTLEGSLGDASLIGYVDANGYRTVAAQSLELKARLEREFLAERLQTRRELGALLGGLIADSLFRSPSVTAAALAYDRLQAQMAANLVGDGWTKAHMTALLIGKERAFAEARRIVRQKVKAAAVWEVGQTLSDAVTREAAAASAKGDSTMLVWSAILDKRTCKACARRHMQVMGKGDPMPPLHPFCRCSVIPIRR